MGYSKSLFVNNFDCGMLHVWKVGSYWASRYCHWTKYSSAPTRNGTIVMQLLEVEKAFDHGLLSFSLPSTRSD